MHKIIQILQQYHSDHGIYVERAIDWDPDDINDVEIAKHKLKKKAAKIVAKRLQCTQVWSTVKAEFVMIPVDLLHETLMDLQGDQ